MYQITDGFRESGVDFAQFEQNLKDIDASTSYFELMLEDIVLCTITGITPDNKILFVRHDTDSTCVLAIDPLLAKGHTQEAIDEGIASGMLILAAKKVFWASQTITNTLWQRIGLGGSNVFSNSLKRNAYAYELMKKTNATVVAMIRKEGPMKKVFAVHSKRYAPMKQITLTKIVEEIKKGGQMGKAVPKEWEMSQFFTTVRVEFPEKADEISKIYGLPDRLIPGIMLYTSDTGDASLACKGYFRMDNSSSVTVCCSHSRKHSGEVNLREEIDEIEQKVFGKFTKMPERLLELLSIDVPNPSLVTKNVLKKCFAKIIGVKRVKELAEAMSYEYNPVMEYTAYDIATKIMDLPARIQGISKALIDAVQEASIEAVFYKYEDTPTKVSLIP